MLLNVIDNGFIQSFIPELSIVVYCFSQLKLQIFVDVVTSLSIS